MTAPAPSPVALTRNALASAIRRTHEQPMPDVEVQRLMDRGWTAGHVEVVEMLAWWAIEHATGIAMNAPHPVHRRREYKVFGTLFGAAGWALGYIDLPVRQVLLWSAIHAAAPDEESASAVDELIFGGSLEEAARGQRWLALGWPGALAFAAGLSLEETEARAQSGALEVAGLCTLVSLRGWLLPDIEDLLAGLVVDVPS